MRRFRFPNLGKRGQSGSAAVEFAMIAPIFFLLLFGILETGLTIFGNMVLENGVKTVARTIRTGQAVGASMTQDQFRQSLCDQISAVLSCDADKLYLDVRSFTSFAGSSYPAPVDANGNLNPNLNSYQLGASSQISNSSDIVLVRAFYTWQLYTPLFGNLYSNMSGNTRLLTASEAFRNEPY